MDLRKNCSDAHFQQSADLSMGHWVSTISPLFQPQEVPDCTKMTGLGLLLEWQENLHQLEG